MQLSCLSVSNTHNSQVLSDENHHAAVQTDFQLHLGVTVRFAILDDPVIGRFIFEIRLTAELCLRFLQEELLQHLEHTPFNKQVICTSNMTQHLIFSRAVSNYLNDHLPWQWIGTGGTYKWQPRFPDQSSSDYYAWAG
jgi:hypothetical protein